MFWTPTCVPPVRTVVPTSAYPRHYSRPWLLGESFRIRHPVGTCSDDRPPPESVDVVTPFLVLVLRSLRVALSAGFCGGRYWSVCGLPAPILSLLGKPMNLRRLVQGNDGSDVPSLALLIATCSQRRPVRFRAYLVLPPLHRLMASRYRGGYAFTVYFSGWELRPTSSTKLLRFYYLPLHP